MISLPAYSNRTLDTQKGTKLGVEVAIAKEARRPRNKICITVNMPEVNKLKLRC